MSTLTCEQALTLITEARELRAEDSTALTRHLAGCDECRMGALSCAEAVSLMERAMARGPASPAAVALASHLVRCDGCRGQADAMLQSEVIMDLVQPPASLTAQLARLTAEHVARQLRLRTFETPLGWTGLAYSDSAIVLVERSRLGAADIHEHVRRRLGDVVAQERPRDDVGEAAARQAGGAARRRPVPAHHPPRPHHPLPPRDRLRQHAGRLRRRPRYEALVAAPGRIP